MIGDRSESVHALILAAGLGSRIAAISANLPKCLIEVGGKPILAHLLEAAGKVGADKVTIVVGHLKERIRDYLNAHHRGRSVELVENSEYRTTGSGRSLELGLTSIPVAERIFLAEGDVVLDAHLPARMADKRHAFPASTLLARYEPHLTGTFVLASNGRVTDWVHETDRSPAFPLKQSWKTVNVTLFNTRGATDQLRNAAKATLARRGAGASADAVMQAVVKGGLTVEAIDVGAARWYEVDTLEDLARARAIFAPVGA